ncbi:MAG: helix-turn-helix transcriptional regulator [bacterium]|nr:helix-turn-helix transcriptional regulator [bacterium]
MEVTRRPAYRRFLKRLKRAREDAGLTQIEVAQRLRRSQAFVSKSESGDRRVDVIELQAFAQLYGKPVQHFFDRN